MLLRIFCHNLVHLEGIIYLLNLFEKLWLWIDRHAYMVLYIDIIKIYKWFVSALVMRDALTVKSVFTIVTKRSCLFVTFLLLSELFLLHYQIQDSLLDTAGETPRRTVDVDILFSCRGLLTLGLFHLFLLDNFFHGVWKITEHRGRWYFLDGIPTIDFPSGPLYITYVFLFKFLFLCL